MYLFTSPVRPRIFFIIKPCSRLPQGRHYVQRMIFHAHAAGALANKSPRSVVSPMGWYERTALSLSFSPSEAVSTRRPSVREYRYCSVHQSSSCCRLVFYGQWKLRPFISDVPACVLLVWSWKSATAAPLSLSRHHFSVREQEGLGVYKVQRL